MPWCPKCKCEYVEGITECQKCGCTLVRELISKDQIVAVGDKEKLLKLRDFLVSEKIDSAQVVFEPGDEVYALISEKNECQEARKLVTFINEKKRREALQNATVGEEKITPAVPFQKASVKAEEMKSSAMTFLVVGGVGLILALLLMCNIIPLPLTNYFRYVVMGVMSALFIIMIIVGIVSLKSYGKLEDTAKEEDKLTKEIVNWYEKNLSKEIIDEGLFDDSDNESESKDIEEESKYFVRIEKIKKIINDKFMNLDPSFVDDISDDVYKELYENEN